MDNKNDNLLEYLDKLKRKAEITRNAHSYSGRRYEMKFKLLRGVSIIGAALSATLIFADYTLLSSILNFKNGQLLRFVVGVLSLSVFLASLLDYVLEYQQRFEKHYQTVRLLTSLIRDIDMMKHLGNSESLRKEDIEKLENRYNWINEQAPIIPDKYFLKSKQEFLQKLEISKALDETPFKSIKEIKNELSKKHNKNDKM